MQESKHRRVVESSDSDGEDVEVLVKKFTRSLLKIMGKSSGKDVIRKRESFDAIGAMNMDISRPIVPFLRKMVGGEASKGKTR